MSAFIFVIGVLSAGVILVRIICLSKSLTPRAWRQHRLRFTLFSLALAGMGGASCALAFGVVHAGGLLLASLAVLILTDRRRTLR